MGKAKRTIGKTKEKRRSPKVVIAKPRNAPKAKRGASSSNRVAQLTRELLEALERQTATSDILKVIASSPSDVQPVFDAIAERSKTLIGGFSSMVLRIFGGMAHLAAFTSTGETGDAAMKAMYPRPTSDIFFFDVLRRGKVLQIENVET